MSSDWLRRRMLALRQRLTSQRGSAVVEFSSIAILIIALFLAVMHVGVYLHIRNTMVASAQAGARYAASANIPPEVGKQRAEELIRSALGSTVSDATVCSVAEEIEGDSAVDVVAVRCTSTIPVFFAWAGTKVMEFSVTGRAIKESV